MRAVVGVAAVFAAWMVLVSAQEECPVGPNGKPCGGNGACVDGKCQCEGRYLAPDCQKQGCLKGCSGNGDCNTETGECKCRQGFSGADCATEVPACPKDADGAECGGTSHGSCDKTTGKCTCEQLWGGPACSQRQCDPLCVGGGHGLCEHGKCICDEGFRGDVCQSKPCPGMVRRLRRPGDVPNSQHEVGVSVDDDARRKAKMANGGAGATTEQVQSQQASTAASFRQISGASTDLLDDTSLAASAEREALRAQSTLVMGEEASFLQVRGADVQDETAAAIMAAAGAIEGGTNNVAASTEPSSEASSSGAPAPAPAAPAAASSSSGAPVLAGLGSMWRFRSRRLHTASGAEVPAVDSDAAIKAALGLAGDDSSLARAVAEDDQAPVSGSSSLRMSATRAEPVQKQEASADDVVVVIEYCNGHGVCRGDGTCECDSGYGGDACELRTCPSNCSSHGDCNRETGTCSCEPGFWGEACEKRSCPGIVSLDDPDLPRVECTGHGQCDAASGQCTCEAPWTGEACDQKPCPGIVSLTEEERAVDPLNRTSVPCSNHGMCLQGPEPGTCACRDGWTGLACARSACGDSHCGHKEGRGECHTVVKDGNERGVCHCAPGFTGEHCELALCPGPGGGCSGHGRCDSLTGVCQCEGQWGGPACRVPAVVHGVVVGKRYPLSLYAELRHHERNRAKIVADLARESAAEQAHKASLLRKSRDSSSSEEEEEAAPEEQKDETKTIGDVLTDPSSGGGDDDVDAEASAEAAEDAALLQRAARRSARGGAAVLAANEDEASAAGGGDANSTTSEESTTDAAVDKATEALEKASNKTEESADELRTRLALEEAQRKLDKANKPFTPKPSSKEVEEAEASGKPLASGMPSTIADVFHTVHKREKLERAAGLDRLPSAISTDAAALGGGAEDDVVFLTRCEPGWTGPTCSERVSSFMCNGGAGCGAHGNCTKWGCLCDRGWSGYDCSVPAAKLACPVGVPVEAEGYYRHLLEVQEAEREHTERLAAETRAAKEAASKQAKEELKEMQKEQDQQSKSAGVKAEQEAEALAEELNAGEDEEQEQEEEEEAGEVAAPPTTATSFLQRFANALGFGQDDAAASSSTTTTTTTGEEQGATPAQIQEALRAMEAMKDVQAKMRERHTYMHGRGVGVPCSGRGVCGSDGRCTCNSGYTGVACEKRVVAHGVCTPRERDPAEQERLEKEQVAREEQAAQAQALAAKRAEEAAHKAEAARKAIAGQDEGSDTKGAEEAEVYDEMNSALEQDAVSRAAALTRPAMLPPPELECMCGTVPLAEAAFPGQMYRGPGCDKLSCPNGCSGHGTCNDNGRCLCKSGFTGPDCSRTACAASCSYRGECALSVAVEHTVAGAMMASRRTRHVTAAERKRAAELANEAAHASETTSSEEAPETLGGLVTGVAGYRRRVAAPGGGGQRRTIGDAARVMPTPKPQKPGEAGVDGTEGMTAEQAQAVGGKTPSSAEVENAIEDLVENAVTPNEAALYTEEGAAAAEEGVETEVEQATEGDQGQESQVFENENNGEQAGQNEEAESFLQRAATSRRRRTHKTVTDGVTKLADSIAIAERASRQAELAAKAARFASQAADGEDKEEDEEEDKEEDEEEGDKEEDEEGDKEEDEEGDKEEEKQEDEEEEKQEEGEEEKQEEGEDAASEDGNAASEDGNAASEDGDAASEDGNTASEDGNAASEAAAPAPPGNEAAAAAAAAAAPNNTTTDDSSFDRKVGSIVKGKAPAAPPLTPAQRRKLRLETALKEGEDPFKLGFPVVARCRCDVGWSGDACEKRVCPNQCSGHGACEDASRRCRCAEGWVGPACAVRADGGCEGGCGGPRRGKCVDGTCFCRAGYSGPGCRRRLCKDDCNSHGVCDTDDGTCKCLPGWAGETCAKKVCPNKCSGHGDCDKSEHTCHCHAGWASKDCSVRLYVQKKEPEPEPSPSPSPSPKPQNRTDTEFVSLERPAHSVFGGTDVLMVLG